MPRYELLRSTTGDHQCLTIEQTVQNSWQLVPIQNVLTARLPGFAPSPLDDLHMTFLHLGRPHELYAEICAMSPTLSRARFDQGIDRLLHAGEQSLESPITATCVRLDQFGAQVVMRLKPEPIWHTSRRTLVDRLLKLLMAWGIATPKAFIRSNPNLQFSLSSAPHVTLGAAPSDSMLPEWLFNVPKIWLGPTSVRGATKQ